MTVTKLMAFELVMGKDVGNKGGEKPGRDLGNALEFGVEYF